jgi:hypothetical protein
MVFGAGGEALGTAISKPSSNFADGMLDGAKTHRKPSFHRLSSPASEIARYPSVSFEFFG